MLTEKRTATTSGPALIVLVITLGLALFGLVVVTGASGPAGDRFGGSTLYYAWRQALSLALGLVFMAVGYAVDYRFWQKKGPLLLLAIFGLLLIVYLPGLGTTHGTSSSRWIDLGPVTFQASEVVKVLLLMILAGMLSRSAGQLTDLWGGLLPVLVILGLIIGLVLIQPDFGTTVVLSLSSLTMLFLAGVRFRHFLGLGCLLLPGAFWVIFKHPYQRERLLSFLDPWKDPRGKGFQIIQSLLSLGSGGLTGVGLGASRQKYSYLPQQFTDFIYAIIGEELGWIGAVGILIAFFLLIYFGAQIAGRCRDDFGRYLAGGIVALIGWQSLINIAVTAGALPVTGIPLPLISYGGTSLVMFLFAVGILLNIAGNNA